MKTNKNNNRWWEVIWIFLSIHLLIVVAFWVYKLMSPHMVDCIEVRVLNAVCWWKKTGTLPYTGVDQIPAFWNPYGPVYEWICKLLPAVIHPYFVGRFISLISTLSIMFVTALWVHHWTRNWSCSMLAALLLLTAKPMFTFGIVHRVGAMAVGLSMMGFTLVLLTRDWLSIVIGAILMVLSFHTKLTAIAAPIACIIALLGKDRPRALLVGGIWFMLIIGSVIVLQITTNGNYLRQAVLGNEPSQWLKPFDMLTRPLTSSPFWVALVFYAWRGAGSHERRAFRAELSYLAIALMIARITSTNPGSSWNYLLDFYVALAMMTGRLIWLMMQKAAFYNMTIIALLLAHALFSIPHTVYFNVKDWASMRKYREEFVKVKAELREVLSNSRRVAVLKSGLVMDVSLSYGLPNYIDLPGEMERQMEGLAMRALQQGQIDLVIFGDTLKVLKARGVR